LDRVSSGKIVGEYELGKDFAASLEAAVKDLRIGWDQVAVIPSSKSGSTDETMMIFVELLSVLIEKQSSKAFADLFLKTLHDLNFPDGANERPGKDLFKVDVKEDGFATTSLVELLFHRASQAGLDVNVWDFIGNVLAGLVLAQVVHIARECGIDTTKYGHLNNGQIRMTLGGVLRKLTKLPEVPEGTDYTEAQKEAADKAIAVRDQITTLAGDFRDANEAADAARIAEKEAAIKAKADAKAVIKLGKVEKTPDIGETDCEGGTLD
jgi:hypothetical protein